MKKILSISIIATSLFLTACGGNEDSTNSNGTTIDKQTYEAEDFTISIPSDWEIIDRNDLTSNIPSDVIVAFRNNVKSESFTANANVTFTELPEDNSLEDFAKNSLAQIKITLIDFQEINNESYELNDETPAYLLAFQGKQGASEMPIVFKQVYVASGSSVYIVTAAYLVQEEESVVKSLDEMLDSFMLK